MEEEARWNGGAPLTGSEQHQKFQIRLDNSRSTVFCIAEYLHHCGFSVQIDAFVYATDASQWQNNVDRGDIKIRHKNGSVNIIEVKGTNRSFSGPSDWGSDFAIVAKKESVERFDNPKYKKPLAYFIVNSNNTHAAIIKWKTRNYWYLHNFKYKNVGNVETQYVCPLEYCEFRDLSKPPPKRSK